MNTFSTVVKKALKQGGISVSAFAKQMGFSDKYVYDLLSKRNKTRWNEDSINKACEILGIEIQFVSKSA
jgi:gp16 family phage-associated protein